MIQELLKQLPIDEDSIGNLIQVRQGIFNDDVDSLAEDVYSGNLSIGAWEEQMRQLIREYNSSIASMAKGGWDGMTQSDWGKLGNPLKEQYKYLHGFAEDVASNRETISLEAIQARAHLYGESSKGTAYIIQTSPDIRDQLPWMPKDGSTECMMNCKCHWALDVLEETDTTMTVLATWTLNAAAESCLDCVDRDGYEVELTLPAGTEIPSSIGGY